MATTKQQQQCYFNQSDNMTSGRDLTPERYKFLKLRKAELERRLSEKYNQLKIVMNMLSEDPTMLGLIKDGPVTAFGVKIGTNCEVPHQKAIMKSEPEFYNKMCQDDLSLSSQRKQSLNSSNSSDNNGHLERHNSLKSSSTQNPSMSMPSLVKHTQNRPNRHYPHPVQHASQMTNQHHVKLKKSHSMIDKKLLALQNNQVNGPFYDLKYRNTTEQFYRDYCLMQSDIQQQHQQQQHQQQHTMEPMPFYQQYPQPTFEMQHHQAMHMPEMLGLGHSGLGGFWAVSSDNKDEKVWQTIPQGLSLDRKAIHRQNMAINEIRRQSPHQPTKSTSLSNFDVFNLKNDEPDDTISISAEMKKREKVWCETALDSSGDNQGGGRKTYQQGHMMAIPAKNIYYHKQQQLHNQQQEQQQRHAVQKAVRHGSDVQRLSPSTNRNLNASYGTLAIGNNNQVSPKYVNMHDSHGNVHTTPAQPTVEIHRNSPIQYHSPLASSASSYRSSDIQTESPIPLQPVNVTVVEQGKIIMPYKEITKPFLMSDFYKYSTKYRQASNNKSEPRNSESSPFEEDVVRNNSPQANLLSTN